MNNPFLIRGPAVVSFSGGRTSGLMLYRILEAHGGTLPEDVRVMFCNTGKERPETLDFVERCSQRWSVPVTWLEYTSTARTAERKKTRNGRLEPPYVAGFNVVDYTTASRNGEPFERIVMDRGMLPNPIARICTVEGKILTTVRYLESIGWGGWDNAIGLRADEPERVKKVLRSERRHPDEEPVFPLHAAGIGKPEVMAFWKSHPFDLELEQDEGNCDLCYLKAKGKLLGILRKRPDLANWWIRMELKIPKGGDMARFRNDRIGYAAMLEHSKRPSLFDPDEPDELSVACHCTD